MVVSNAGLVHNPRKIELFRAQRGQCAYCDRSFDYRKLTRDHVMPRSKGHSKRMNIVLVCWGCNARKADELPTQDQLSRARQIYAACGKPAFEIG